MSNEELEKEQKYLKSKKKIAIVALIILCIGLSIGGFLIYKGIEKKGSINAKYSDENKASIKEQLSQEKSNLEKKLKELESSKTASLKVEKTNLLKQKSSIEKKIKPVEDEIKKLERIEFRGFDKAYYARKDKIESLKKSIESDKKSISIIEKALDENFDNCSFSETKNNKYTAKYCSIVNNQSDDLANINVIRKALDESFNNCSFTDTKNNSLTSKYCSLKQEYDDLNDDFNKNFDSHDSVPFYIFGGFIIFTTLIISGSVYSVSKRREIMEFGLQQSKPITDELSKVSGNFAKEIAKGIKEGQETAQVPHVVRCKHCGAENEIIGKTGVCEYCKSKISYEK